MTTTFLYQLNLPNILYSGATLVRHVFDFGKCNLLPCIVPSAKLLSRVLIKLNIFPLEMIGKLALNTKLITSKLGGSPFNIVIIYSLNI